MNAKFCSKCGSSFEATDQYCSKCGQANETSGQVEEPSQVSQLVSDEVTNSKKTKGFKYALVIVLIALIGGGYFIIAPSRSTIDANKMTASQMMNWLIENKYCTKEEPSSLPKNRIVVGEIDKKMLDSYLNNESRLCIFDTKEFPAKDYRTNTWSSASAISIQVADARIMFNMPGDKSIPKSPYNVIGKNWTLMFMTSEAGYKGIYAKTKKDMLSISGSLNGKISSNYGPIDNCASIKFEFENITVQPNSKEKSMLKDCELNAPEYMKSLSIWQD